MSYGQEPVVGKTVAILRTIFKDGWSHFQLIVEANDEYNHSRCMTGPEFRNFFGGSNAKDTAELISKYNGQWEHKSHMKITFEQFDDAKRFVDDVIAPHMLMGRMIANG